MLRLPKSGCILQCRQIEVSARTAVKRRRFSYQCGHFALRYSKQFGTIRRCGQQASFPSNISSIRQQVRHLVHNAPAMEHRAFIALGSNLGDRVAMIEEACKEMDRRGKMRVLRTSSLWETKAMYVLDQDNFVNGVCEVGFSCRVLS